MFHLRNLLLPALVVVAITNVAVAANPTFTAITVEKMHCKGCVQKIAAQLYSVRGVKEVRVDMKKKTLFVMPQSNKVLSPRAMWEAVEKGNDRPVRLAGPTGTFTAKPKS